MMLLVLAAVVGPQIPEQHPALAEALAVIDHDTIEVQKRDLGVQERMKLALEIRHEGARVPALTVGEPAPVQKQARNLERHTGRLLVVLGKNDEEAIGREAGLVQEQVSKLRAAVEP